MTDEPKQTQAVPQKPDLSVLPPDQLKRRRREVVGEKRRLGWSTEKILVFLRQEGYPGLEGEGASQIVRSDLGAIAPRKKPRRPRQKSRRAKKPPTPIAEKLNGLSQEERTALRRELVRAEDRLGCGAMAIVKFLREKGIAVSLETVKEDIEKIRSDDRKMLEEIRDRKDEAIFQYCRQQEEVFRSAAEKGDWKVAIEASKNLARARGLRFNGNGDSGHKETEAWQDIVKDCFVVDAPEDKR